jgi:hypothetical protein
MYLLNLCRLVHLHFSCAMLDYMDRTWVHGKLFTSVYMDGVKEFMRSVKEKFNDNIEILCPCSR